MSIGIIINYCDWNQDRTTRQVCNHKYHMFHISNGYIFLTVTDKAHTGWTISKFRS